MVLSKKEITDHINNSAKHAYKFIDPVNPDNIKSASYDLTLGDEYYIEVKSIRNNRFILSDSEIKKAENAKDKYILALVFWENTTYLGLKYLKSPMKKLNTKMAKKRLEFLLE